MSVFRAAIYNHCIFCPSLCLFPLLSCINKAEDDKVNYNNGEILTNKSPSDGCSVILLSVCTPSSSGKEN